MTILIVVLLAFVIVLILYMVSLVYQMNRDNKAKFTKLTQKQMALEHKLDALESIVARMREVPQQDE